MDVLVTGLSGFTGRYVRAELEAEGHRVSGLDCDLRDPNAVSARVERCDPQAVLHLAGIAFVGHDNAEANTYYQVNTIGTRNLLDALHHSAPRLQAVMLASSANIYGNQAEGIVSESFPPNPVNDYAVSKYAMERVARLWVDRLPIFIVRPFNYTGVAQSENFLIPKIVSHFRNARPSIELGNVRVAREFNDVRSVAEIYRRLLEVAPLGQTVNVCTGRAYAVSEVIEQCSRITGHSLTVQFDPKLARAHDPLSLSGDNSLLRDLVGPWKDFGLGETLTWMLEH